MRIVETKNNLTVSKQEALVQARYSLGELAVKLMSLIISMVNKDDQVFNVYTLKVKDFSNLVGIDGRSIYENFKKAGEELMENPIYIPKEKGFLMINWVSSFEYVENEATIEISIDPKLIPYLIEFRNRFLKYKLRNILSLRSSYSIRLYELLKDKYNLNKRYETSKTWEVSVKEIRSILRIPESYNFGGSSGVRERIIEKAKDELLEHTDIKFTYKEIKTGRKVTDIKFIIKENEKNSDVDPLLKDLKTFTDYLRDIYSKNGKSFYTAVDKDRQTLIYMINKERLLYIFNMTTKEKEYRNGDETALMYKTVYEWAKKSPTYFDVLKNAADMYDIFRDDAELYFKIIKEIS